MGTTILLIVLIVILVVLVIFAIVTYNGLVRRRTRPRRPTGR
jgi:hypothetical protein